MRFMSNFNYHEMAVALANVGRVSTIHKVKIFQKKAFVRSTFDLFDKLKTVLKPECVKFDYISKKVKI